MSDKKTGFFAGKGYYIALILCAAAIGISGYVYYNDAAGEDSLQQADEAVIATDRAVSGMEDTPVVKDQSEPSVTTSIEETMGALDTCMPVSGQVIADYAMECLSYNQTTRDWPLQNGLDLAAEAGTEAVAAAGGQVYSG